MPFYMLKNMTKTADAGTEFENENSSRLNKEFYSSKLYNVARDNKWISPYITTYNVIFVLFITLFPASYSHF